MNLLRIGNTHRNGQTALVTDIRDTKKGQTIDLRKAKAPTKRKVAMETIKREEMVNFFETATQTLATDRVVYDLKPLLGWANRTAEKIEAVLLIKIPARMSSEVLALATIFYVLINYLKAQ